MVPQSAKNFAAWLGLQSAEVAGNKQRFEAVNRYSRCKGETERNPFVIRKCKFSIYDENPLAVAGVPEIREYRFTGVVQDEEIGLPSGVKEIAFAG